MTRVTLVGLGAIGREVFKALTSKTSLRVVAVADPAFAGQDAGAVCGVAPTGVVVVTGVEEAFAVPSDVALVLTTSGTAEMVPIVARAAEHHLHVVSSCEDLAFAELSTPEHAHRIDELARAAGIVVLGTGVNPGFVMDRLPLALAGACVAVRGARVERVVDASRRREPLRAKVGADLTVAEFEAGVAARRLGHRGLPESCRLLARGLGLSLDEVRSSIAPVVASVIDPRPGIAPGRVAGLRQSAVGLAGGRELVRLELEMSVGAPDPHDRVVLDSDPPLSVLIEGGTHGDRGTVGTIVNAIAAVRTGTPGLRHIDELALFGIVT